MQPCCYVLYNKAPEAMDQTYESRALKKMYVQKLRNLSGLVHYMVSNLFCVQFSPTLW